MRRVTLALALLAACSSKKDQSTPDAHIVGQDSTIVVADVPIDNPLPPPGCDYAELSDATNDDYNMGTPEASMISFTAAKTFCGNVNGGHFDAANKSIDIDAFAFNVATEGDVIVTLSGTGLAALDFVGIEIWPADASKQISNGSFYNDHGVNIAHLPAGDYVFDVVAGGTADIAAAVPYKIKIETDAPTTRCAKSTTAADYTEAHDGTTNLDNDVMDIKFGPGSPFTITAATTDAPEPTNFTLAATGSSHLTGTIANIDNPDSYKDQDTYLVKTGAATNQLAIRVNWASTTADLDLYVFEENTTNVVGGSFVTAATEGEFATFSVKPNTNYWVWIGAFDDDTTTLPATYDATLCGETYTAP